MKIINFIKSFYFMQEAEVLSKSNFKIYGVNCSINKFGNKNKNKIFYIIRRSPGAGLFSNLIFVLNHLKIAEEHNFIPYVDMENFPTIYNEPKKINNTSNSWEYFFNQVSNFSLREIYSSNKVIITDDQFYDFFTHDVNHTSFVKIFKKYIKIKKIYLDQANNFIRKNLTNKKILALHYRGTSFKTSAKHPFPPTFKQLKKKIDKLIAKKKYSKIFLSTEDLAMFNKLNFKYKNLICSYNSFRSKKDDAFIKYERKNHRYLLGKEILIESIIMSNCSGFLFIDSNVSTFVKLLTKFRKIDLFEIKNGYNSENEYYAKWLWYIKFVSPAFLGGFKNEI